ncbi:PorV/PorQ family protein [candidate division KSB1 bacterium]|nr:PorV/PorQ family protein [candidate division KSB1 bacterium]
MRLKLVKVFFACLVIFLSVIPTHAGGFRTAKYGGEFLTLGAGGRALGMGGAYAALANDVSAGYWNPAGLVSLDYPQIMLMHSEQFSGVVKYDYGSFAMPLGTSRSVGIGLIRLGVDDIPVTRLSNPALKLGAEYVDENGITRRNTPYVVRTISDAEYALFLSYGLKRNEKLAFGANAKIIHKNVGDNSAWGLGFDIGAIYKPAGNLLVGLNLQDITTTVLAWDSGTREIIVPALKAGVAYPLNLSKLGGAIVPAVDFDIRFEGRDYAAQYAAGPVSLDSHLGWEFQFQDLFALRVGSDVGKLSAGAGINLPKFQVDYAFLSHDELGNSHRISARLSLEGPQYRRR